MTTAQNDIDMLFFKDATLYGVDVATDVNRTELFTLDPRDGRRPEQRARQPGRRAPAHRVGRQPRQGVSWRLGGRQLLTIDLATGALTPIGETHPVTAYGNATIRAFFVAPAPTCP